MDGWIKLHRKIWDNPIVTKDSDHLAVWVWLLTHATHRERAAMFGGEKILLAPGQLITGRKQISEATGVNESKVKRILELFKSDQQIDQQTNRHGSVISIVRWVDYQKSDQQNDQLMTNQWPTSDQPVTTKQEREEYKERENDLHSLKDEARRIISNEKAGRRLDEMRARIRAANERRKA